MSFFNKNRDISQAKQKYSIKKLKLGAASVLVGLSFLGYGSSQSVLASENQVVGGVSTNVTNQVIKVRDDNSISNMESSVSTVASGLNTDSSATTVASGLNTDSSASTLASELNIDSSASTLASELNIDSSATTVASELNTDSSASTLASGLNIDSSATTVASGLNTESSVSTVASELNTESSVSTITSTSITPDSKENHVNQPVETFVEFSNRVFAAEQPKEVIYHELSKVYTSQDVEGILKYIDISKISNQAELREAIQNAGVLYAKEKRRFPILAVRTTEGEQLGNNVNHLMTVREIKLTSSKEPANRQELNTINIMQGESAYLYIDVKVKEGVNAGDYITIKFDEYLRPGALNIPYAIPVITDGKVPLAYPKYDPQTNRIIYTFLEPVFTKL